jgi:hypothetical protein
VRAGGGSHKLYMNVKHARHVCVCGGGGQLPVLVGARFTRPDL